MDVTRKLRIKLYILPFNMYYTKYYPILMKYFSFPNKFTNWTDMFSVCTILFGLARVYCINFLFISVCLLYSSPTDEYEEPLPQQLVFGSEPLPRSPSPDQLPEPAQTQEHTPNTNCNNCQDNTEIEVPTSSSFDDVLKEDDSSIKEDEAALAYRRNSLQTGQDSRKRLRALYKQNSLSKLRQSITDVEVPALPSGDSIPEEM